MTTTKSAMPLTNSEKFEKLKTKDSQYQKEMTVISQKQRFGLFSYPLGLDTNFDMQKPTNIVAESTNYRSFNPK